MDPPTVQVYWFKALNNPRVPQTPQGRAVASELNKKNESKDTGNQEEPGQDQDQLKIITDKQNASKTPTQWAPFSIEESNELEEAYQRWCKGNSKKSKSLTIPFASEWKASSQSEENLFKIVIGEHFLFEVDIEKRLMYPIYWDGPALAVTRSIWFTLDSTGKYTPVDENLSGQLEDGYMKFQPWKHFSEGEEQFAQTIPSPSTAGANVQTPETFKWALFGPYSNSYILYTGHHSAWLMSDTITAKVTQAIYSRFSYGGNLGGAKLLRGYENVEKLLAARKVTKKSVSASSSLTATPVAVAATVTTPTPVEAEESTVEEPSWSDKKSNIKHLVLATHGMGQKLGERMTIVNFVEDINNLRKTVHDVFDNYYIPSKKTDHPDATKYIKGNPGVMIIPVEWRKRLNFEKIEKQLQELTLDSDSSLPSLKDITLETVPTLRDIISDVLLDVLLYMEPHHRTDMIHATVDEMNKVYSLFIARHPKFLQNGGKVHFYAHSLGTLICMDILCHHSNAYSRYLNPTLRPEDMRRDEDMTPIDLGDFMNTAPDYLQALGVSNRMSEDTASVLSTSLAADTHQQKNKAQKQHRPTLDFPVDKFFAAGSPISLFLRLKEKRLGVPLQKFLQYYEGWWKKKRKPTAKPRTEEEEAQYIFRKGMKFVMQVEEKTGVLHPDVNAVYHIFHPNDVIAYRLEPSICRDFAKQKPYLIPPCTKASITRPKLPIPNLSFTWEELSSRASETFVPTWVKSYVSSTSADQKDKADDSKESGEETGEEHEMTQLNSSESLDQLASADSPTRSFIASKSHPPIPKFKPDEAISLLNPRFQRLDFTLPESMLELHYYSALQAHFLYWKDEQSLLFVLKEILIG